MLCCPLLAKLFAQRVKNVVFLKRDWPMQLASSARTWDGSNGARRTPLF